MVLRRRLRARPLRPRRATTVSGEYPSVIIQPDSLGARPWPALQLDRLILRKRRHDSQGFDVGELPCACQPACSLALEARDAPVPRRRPSKIPTFRRSPPSSPRRLGSFGSGRLPRFSTRLRSAGTLIWGHCRGLRQSPPIVVVVRGIYSHSWRLTAAGADPHRQSRRQDPLEFDSIGLFTTGRLGGSQIQNDYRPIPDSFGNAARPPLPQGAERPIRAAAIQRVR